MTRRKLRHDSTGVSTVIGAILVAGLLVTTLVTVRVSFVPVWQKADETERLIGLESRLTTMRADMDRQVGNRTSTTLTHSILLGSRGSGVFAAGPASEDLVLLPNNAAFEVESNQLRLLRSNGVDIARIDPTWTSIGTGVMFDDVVQLDVLRLRIAEVSSAQDGLDATITVRNATNALVGTMTIGVTETSGVDFNVIVQTADDAGTIITEIVESYHGVGEYAPYFVDALDPVYLLDSLLASSSGPLTLTLADDVGFETDYVVVYAQATTGSLPVLVASSGSVKVGYQKTFSGGSLEYRSATTQLPRRTYVLENGALIVSQDDGAAFKVRPDFQVSRSTGMTSIALAVPTIIGESASRSGIGHVTITTSSTTHTSIEANAPRLDITIETRFPDLWIDFWDTTLADAGLVSVPGAVQYETVRNSDESATLIVYGVTTDPGSTQYDLTIFLHQADISVTLEA